MNKIDKLLEIYKKRIEKDYLDDLDKGLITTYLEEFVKELKAINK